MTDAAFEIKKMWNIFAVGPDSVIELRALWPKGVPDEKPVEIKRFRAASYTSLDRYKETVERTALELNRQGFNIYMVMNPIRFDVTRAGAAKDTDIRCRNLLLIDIDRVGDTSVPANQPELDAAQALARKVRDEMAGQGWYEPVVVMSGNGFHLYYALDALPNDDAATALISRTLNELAAKFNNEIVGVDTTVSNASRITKVPGTIMRKGIATEDRPYRMAVVCDDC